MVGESERVLKDLEGALKYLPASKNIGKFTEEITQVVDKIKSLSTRSNIYMSLAQGFKYFAQLDGIRDNCMEASKYFLKKSAENGAQYDLQHEMLPEMFDRDKPVSTGQR
ncbi:MAG: hypothetical protein Q8N63_04275 [Nanoarchaeota archaeon]|nr:hypothetical protein [Nanoarchaeota archaeon]